MPVATYVRDHAGRLYRVGETDVEVSGRSRRTVLWAVWAAMLAAGIGQYGFGALIPALQDQWSVPELFWALALWTVCQAGTAFPAAWLRQQKRLTPTGAMWIGAVLTGAGFFTLGQGQLVGYAVLGGIGAGLVYATCLGTIVRWYPERVTRKVAFVSGAFAYGSVPFVLAAGMLLQNLGGFLTQAAIAITAVVAVAGAVMKDPPEHWWPPHVQPREWALDRARVPNRAALKEFRTHEAMRCGAFWWLYGGVAFAAAVSLYDLAYLPLFVGDRTLGAVALATLAAATGTGRVLVGWISDRVGRRKALIWTLATGGCAQFVLLYSQNFTGLLIGAALAGLGTGCCYSVLVGVTREYFGETNGAQNFGVLYTAKAAGALIAAIVLASQGPAFAFVAAGVLGLSGAVLTGQLSQPGRPRL
ncbi:MFS transporter [Lentzea sp. NPDC005914]|uniref:MFS transporter n=1 Tax=Lentzea sp. NPDC005914 TaxID=3154572 RepID=UPI0033C3211A